MRANVATALEAMGGVLEVLLIMHCLDLVHRDVRPPNCTARGALIDMGHLEFGCIGPNTFEEEDASFWYPPYAGPYAVTTVCV